MESFTQLGIAGATLLILLFVVRYFISAMDKKDTYIQSITEKFSETVNTHLANENIARQQEMKALTQVTGVLDQHTQVLSQIVNYNTRIADGMDKLAQDAKRIKYGRRKTDNQLTRH